MSTRRVLVTGGAGYIGSHTAKLLSRSSAIRFHQRAVFNEAAQEPSSYTFRNTLNEGKSP